jgi:integrase
MNTRCYGPGRLEKGNNYAGNAVVHYGVWTDARGHRRRRILSSDRRVAERALAKVIRERDLSLLGLSDEEGQERCLGELRDAYLQDMVTWASKGHLRRITGILARILDEIGDIPVREVRQDRVLAYRQKRLRLGRANRTVNQETGALKALLNWAAACGLIARNPIAALKPLPSGKAHEKRPRRALLAQEIETLLEAAERIDRHMAAYHAAERSIRQGRGKAFEEKERRPHVPQGPLWRAFVFTGARWGELTATVWGDVDLGNRAVTLRPASTKSKKGRTIPLLDTVVEDLVGLRDVHEKVLGREPGPADFVFLGPRGKPVRRSYRRALYRFEELLKETGIPRTDEMGRGVDIHSLRHTFCSELGRAGVGLTQAQALMGHSTPVLTANLYTHLGIEDLRGAMDKLDARRSGSAGLRNAKEKTA